VGWVKLDKTKNVKSDNDKKQMETKYSLNKKSKNFEDLNQNYE